MYALHIASSDILIGELERVARRAPGESEDDANARIKTAKAKAREHIAALENADATAAEQVAAAAAELGDKAQHKVGASQDGFREAQARRGAARPKIRQSGRQRRRADGRRPSNAPAIHGARRAGPRCPPGLRRRLVRRNPGAPLAASRERLAGTGRQARDRRRQGGSVAYQRRQDAIAETERLLRALACARAHER